MGERRSKGYLEEIFRVPNLKSSEGDTSEQRAADLIHLDQIGSRKRAQALTSLLASLEDELSIWVDIYLDLVIEGVRSREIAQKIALHLAHFRGFFQQRYSYERISTVHQVSLEA